MNQENRSLGKNCSRAGFIGIDFPLVPAGVNPVLRSLRHFARLTKRKRKRVLLWTYSGGDVSSGGMARELSVECPDVIYPVR